MKKRYKILITGGAGSIGSAIIKQIAKKFNHINNDEPGKNGEIQITDAILSDIANFVGYEFDGKRFDCGSKIGYLKANVEFGLADGELGPALAEYLKGKKDL